VPHIGAIAQHAARGKSWMLPEARNQALLYVSDQAGSGQILVLAYPKMKLVGILAGLGGTPMGLCSDKSGNVYVPTSIASSQSYVYEYSHAGTGPIKTLSDPGFANSCAVDPTSGDLAVTNYFSTQSYGDIAVYKGAQGDPSTYQDAAIPAYLFCAYDDVGDLFADGKNESTFAELPDGGNALASVTLDQAIGPESLQWVDTGLTITANGHGIRGPKYAYEVTVSGSSANVGQQIILKAKGNREPGPVQFLVSGTRMIGPAHSHGTNGLVNVWKYPEGGEPIKSFKIPGSYHAFFGVALSP
jgi:hypothetical protein